MEAKVAESPFLPGTNIQFAWDSTSLGYLKTCPRLYYYVIIMGYDSLDESVHLRFGQEYHTTLEDYEKGLAAGLKHDDAQHDAVRELLIRTEDWETDRDTRAGKYKNRESVVMATIWHMEHYRDDPAKTYILDDGRPAVELSFRFELDYGPIENRPYVLCGHLDRVVRFQDTLFVMDHKTTTTTPGSYYFNQFEPHNQMSLYTLASQVILEAPIKGVIIDAAQILVDSVRFVRGFTYRTEELLEEWSDDLEHWFNIAENYAEQNYWPQNDTACDKFGGCRFREICSKSPGVRDKFLNSNFKQLSSEEKWNPLKPR